MMEPSKTVVITEASSGLGAAAVRAFTGRGNRGWGVHEVIPFTQPRQDALLKEMQLDNVLGWADA
jgi:NAD(P)-dependent dehydrogenase (short-subunit alcohol dehydrogenase family)